MHSRLNVVKHFAVLLVVLAGVVVSSCDGPNEPLITTFYMPTYLSFDRLRNGVALVAPQPLVRPGKMAVHSDHLYVVDSLSGIHIYDCANPGSPVQVAFIKVPGANQFAISDNVLYAVSYVDLLTFDISIPAQTKLRHRAESIFPQQLHSDTWEAASADSGVVIAWVGVVGEFISSKNGVTTATVHTAVGVKTLQVESINPTVHGTRLSASTIDVVNQHILAGSQNELHILNIGNKWSPTPWSRIDVGWSVTHTYVHHEYFFVGASSSVKRYNISDPASPVELSQLYQARPCDRIAARDNIVYVAARVGSGCSTYRSYLDVVDITDKRYSESVAEHALEEPFAVVVEGARLYVCDGVGGFKVYDVSIPSNPVLLSTYPLKGCYNVILQGTTAFVTTHYGLHVLDCTNPAAITELSVLRVVL